MNKDTCDIAIVGGGAAGLAAAICAAREGRGGRVVVLEKLDRVGKKLLATGNGRCNLGNASIDVGNYSSGDEAALADMLSRAPSSLTLDFFESVGLLCDVELSGRIYPFCRQASMALDALRHAAERLGVETLCGFDVKSVQKSKDGFSLVGADDKRLKSRAVILAAGGCAAAQLGSDGAGFALARSLGHTVTPLEPCLVPLKCALDDKSLKGIRAVCTATLVENSRELHSDTGEVQFTEYGLSGIPAMQLSRFYSAKNNPRAEVRLDFLPQFTREQAAALLARRLADERGGIAGDLLLGALNKRISALLLKRAGVAPSQAVESVTPALADALLGQLKGFALKVEGTLPWAQAQATRGGVPLCEINPLTCESRVCEGLFLAGELLDAVGECGGYNLHWAWTTGALAGKASKGN